MGRDRSRNRRRDDSRPRREDRRRSNRRPDEPRRNPIATRANGWAEGRVPLGMVTAWTCARNGCERRNGGQETLCASCLAYPPAATQQEQKRAMSSKNGAAHDGKSPEQSQGHRDQGKGQGKGKGTPPTPPGPSDASGEALKPDWLCSRCEVRNQGSSSTCKGCRRSKGQCGGRAADPPASKRVPQDQPGSVAGPKSRAEGAGGHTPSSPGPGQPGGGDLGDPAVLRKRKELDELEESTRPAGGRPSADTGQAPANAADNQAEIAELEEVIRRREEDLAYHRSSDWDEAPPMVAKLEQLLGDLRAQLHDLWPLKRQVHRLDQKVLSWEEKVAKTTNRLEVARKTVLEAQDEREAVKAILERQEAQLEACREEKASFLAALPATTVPAQAAPGTPRGVGPSTCAVDEAFAAIRAKLVHCGQDPSVLEEMQAACGITTPADNDARLKRAAAGPTLVDLEEEEEEDVVAASQASPKRQNRGTGEPMDTSELEAATPAGMAAREEAINHMG